MREVWNGVKVSQLRQDMKVSIHWAALWNCNVMQWMQCATWPAKLIVKLQIVFSFFLFLSHSSFVTHRLAHCKGDCKLPALQVACELNIYKYSRARRTECKLSSQEMNGTMDDSVLHRSAIVGMKGWYSQSGVSPHCISFNATIHYTRLPFKISILMRWL